LENSKETEAKKIMHGIENTTCTPNIEKASNKAFFSIHLKIAETEKERKNPFKKTRTGVTKKPKAVKPNMKISNGYFEKLNEGILQVFIQM